MADLGTILLGAGLQYAVDRWGQPAPQQVFSGGTLPSVSTGGGAMPPVVIDQGGGYGGGCPKGMRWSNAQGGWVRKTRRRRKRLATASDLSDLAALKGVLGAGEAFKVWIATHS